MAKKSIYLFAHPFKPLGLEAAKQLFELLTRAGVPVYCEAWLQKTLTDAIALPLEQLSPDTTALIAIGGDGTLLRAAPYAAKNHVPMLGIHTGTIGFLMEADFAGAKAAVKALLLEAYTLDQRMLLSCSLQGEPPSLALNDCSITRGEHPGVLSISVFAFGQRVYDLTGDGVLISTPTGATAYALAAGAPIVHPQSECLLITPLCAREILARPVILPAHALITLTVKAQERRRPQFSLDGQLVQGLAGDAAITICKADVSASFIRFEEHHFFDQLRMKQAHWNHL